MAKDSRFEAELEYLSDFTADVLRELYWLIASDGACQTFESRMSTGGADCRHCAFTKAKH